MDAYGSQTEKRRTTVTVPIELAFDDRARGGVARMYITLAALADDHGQVVVSLNRLVEITGVRQRTVMRHLDILIDMEVIRRERRRTGWGTADTSRYHLI